MVLWFYGSAAYILPDNLQLVKFIEMKQLLWSLDYLCIEVISKNIQRFSKTSKANWKLRICNDLGDRLILACLSNSLDEMDENTYRFILDNFMVRNFKIFCKMFEKVEYFDFLNGKSFDNLEINLKLRIKLKNKDKNFRIITNKLILNTNLSKESLAESHTFFSNIFVKKDMMVSICNINNNNRMEMQKLLLIMLDNTSKHIENIDIPFENMNKEFIEKSIEILCKRKKLKNLYTIFDERVPKSIRVFFVINNFTIDCDLSASVKSYLNSIDIKDSFKSFDSIENVYIKFKNNKNFEEIEEIFSIFNSLNLENLKEVCISLCNTEYYGKHFHNFLANCLNLEKLTLSDVDDYNFNIFDSILSCSKSLKVFKLYSIEIDNPRKVESFKTFLSKSSLQELILERISFNNEYSLEVIQYLEHLKNTLTSLAIIFCTFSNETIHFLFKVLKKFKSLKCFHFDHSKIITENFVEIFQSLQSSSQTLQDIFICKPFNGMKLKNCFELLNLLNNCKKLTTIYIRTYIDDDKIPELLSILKKFENNLEVINLDLCYSEKYHKELFNFLSGFSKLKYVYRDILGKAWSLEDNLMKSLLNSRYSLRFVHEHYEYYLNSFPYILTD